MSLDKDEKAWKAAIKTDGLNWNSHAWDKQSEVSRKYGVTSIPYGFLINGEGKIVAQGNGETECYYI